MFFIVGSEFKAKPSHVGERNKNNREILPLH